MTMRMMCLAEVAVAVHYLLGIDGPDQAIMKSSESLQLATKTEGVQCIGCLCGEAPRD
jgi:hypothetical protein